MGIDTLLGRQFRENIGVALSTHITHVRNMRDKNDITCVTKMILHATKKHQLT